MLRRIGSHPTARTFPVRKTGLSNCIFRSPNSPYQSCAKAKICLPGHPPIPPSDEEELLASTITSGTRRCSFPRSVCWLAAGSTPGTWQGLCRCQTYISLERFMYVTTYTLALIKQLALEMIELTFEPILVGIALIHMIRK